MSEGTGRIPELDGLRGVAILMVMADHIFPQAEKFYNVELTRWISSISGMGWAGVDVFFVLSGFLITGILLRMKLKPHYFRNFYARRVLRIFPVFYVLLTVLFLVYYLAGWADIRSILGNALWFYSYAHNWLFALNQAPGLYFGHLWSLAIEEQFYFLWPLIVFYFDTPWLMRFGAVTMVVALLVRVGGVFAGTGYGNTFPYYSTISRADGLMLGSIIAIGFQTGLKERFSRDASKLLLLAALLVAACIAFKPASPLWNNGAMLTVGFSGLALLAGAVLIISQTRDADHIVRRCLRSPLLQFCGTYSYALYLFHWPVASMLLTLYMDKGLTGPAYWLLFSFVAFSATVALALLSWRVLEEPLLSLKRYFV